MINKSGLFKHKLLTIVSILAIILTIDSCKKEDDVKPIIEVLNTIKNTYSVNDSIHIRAKITDNEALKQVSVYIINNHNQRVTKPYVFNISGKEYSLDTRYIIDNLYLKGGDYYFVIEAKDEFNRALKYLPITINALARGLKDILIVEAKSNQTSIYSIFPEKTLIKTLGKPYQDLMYNAYAQQYVFLSKDGVLSAHQEEDFEEVWQETELNNMTHPFLGKLCYREQKIFVSTGKGDIRSFNEDGQSNWQANSSFIDADIKDYQFFKEELLSINRSWTLEDDQIERFNLSTGASTHNYPLNFSPEKVVNVEDKLYLILGNTTHTAKACSLSTHYHLVQEFKVWNNRHITDAFRYSKYHYLLAFDDKVIEYYLPNDYERELVSLSSPTQFYYDDLHERLFYIENNKIFLLKYPSEGAELYYTNDQKINDLIFVYNK